MRTSSKGCYVNRLLVELLTATLDQHTDAEDPRDCLILAHSDIA